VRNWGPRFRDLRNKRGFSQDAIAEEANTSKKTVIAFERRGDVGWSILQEMINALGMTEAEFFESKIPPKYANPKHQELHEQLQDILEAEGEWENGIRLNVESIHKNLMDKQAEQIRERSKAEGAAKPKKRA